MLKNISSIIFDIGNVIIDIEYKNTIAEFQKLSDIDFNSIVSYHAQIKLFDLFETGKVTAQQFRDELKKYLKAGTTDAQIDFAWNAIFTGYPLYKFELLLRLKTQYKTFALSNINEIHVNTIDKYVINHFGARDMNSYFHKAYYSNEVGFRKPDPKIYEYILNQEKLIPSETFFIDDKLENIEAAKAMGIVTYHLTDRDKLMDIFSSAD
jgi:putative hydrolase of the HAD superfamily